MSTELKRCGLCGLNLQLKFFTPDTRTTDGRSTYCVDCQYLIADPQEVMNPMQPHLADTVHCHKCGDFKPRDQFTPDKRQKSGLYQWCKTCWRSYMNDRRHKRSKKVTVQQQMLAHIRVAYGDEATPLSIMRGGHEDVPDKLFSWFPHMDHARVRQIFYDMCVEEATPKENQDENLLPSSS